MTENWLPVPGYEESYEVSDHGRVRSHRPWRGTAHRLLSPYPVHGYLQVALSQAGKVTRWRVHQLVLLAFVGPCPPGHETRHGPAGKLDNRLVSLCYGTRAENIADRERDGGQRHAGAPGTRNGHAKLTPALAAEIRARVAAGEQQAAVARQMKVGKSTVCRVVHHRCWGDGTVQAAP